MCKNPNSFPSMRSGFIQAPKFGAGFTLLELLVVFSLISVLSGLGFASLASYSKKQTLVQASEDLKQAINSARFNSVSSIKPSGSCSDSDTLTGYRFDFCDYSTPTCAYKYQVVALCGSNPVILSKDLPQSVSFSQTGLSYPVCQSIIFSARAGDTTGSVPALPCQVKMVNSSLDQVMVTINENGNTTIQ